MRYGSRSCCTPARTRSGPVVVSPPMRASDEDRGEPQRRREPDLEGAGVEHPAPDAQHLGRLVDLRRIDPDGEPAADQHDARGDREEQQRGEATGEPGADQQESVREREEGQRGREVAHEQQAPASPGAGPAIFERGLRA